MRLLFIALLIVSTFILRLASLWIEDERLIMSDNLSLMQSELQTLSRLKKLDAEVFETIKDHERLSLNASQARKRMLDFYDRNSQRYNFEMLSYIKNGQTLLSMEFFATLQSNEALKEFLALQPKGMVLSIQAIEHNEVRTQLQCQLLASYKE